MAIISGSVGLTGLNKRIDVKTVQHLLNRKIHMITPLRPLVEDGYVGDLTIAAILEFQKRVVKLAQPDGRVDTGGKTQIALNRTPTLDTPVKKAPKVKEPGGADPITVTYAGNVAGSGRLVSEYAFEVVKMALQQAGMRKALITSTLRLPADQARIMYDNAKSNLAKQQKMYGSGGKQVLKVFEEHYQSKSRAEVIELMRVHMIELNKAGTRTSRHVTTAGEYAKLNVFDIGVKSTRSICGDEFSIPKLTAAFKDLVKEGYISHFIDETAKSNSCWHLEIRPGQKKLPSIA